MRLRCVDRRIEVFIERGLEPSDPVSKEISVEVRICPEPWLKILDLIFRGKVSDGLTASANLRAFTLLTLLLQLQPFTSQGAAKGGRRFYEMARYHWQRAFLNLIPESHTSSEGIVQDAKGFLEHIKPSDGSIFADREARERSLLAPERLRFAQWLLYIANSFFVDEPPRENQVRKKRPTHSVRVGAGRFARWIDCETLAGETTDAWHTFPERFLMSSLKGEFDAMVVSSKT